MNIAIDLLAEEKPEYKVCEKGSLDSLTSVELLSMLLGETTDSNLRMARSLLNMVNGSLSGLSKLTSQQIKEAANFTDQNVNSILAALELGRRAQAKDTNCTTLDSAIEIYQFMVSRIGHLAHEEAWIMLMNNSLSLIKAKQLSIGGLTETAFDIRLMLKEALLNNATVIAVAHNHPSGNRRPSGDDDRVTKKLKGACDTMRIHLLDHVIVTDIGYYSYSEEGRL